VQRSAQSAGSAASTAEGIKTQKYASLAVIHEFVPIVIETLGTWGALAAAFTNELGRRTAAITGDKRAASFLKQRLAFLYSAAMLQQYLVRFRRFVQKKIKLNLKID